MKRVLTIQDISCVGKCSLTVALPIISAMGVETSVLPTAVLSTHTAFKNFTFRDLTSDISGIIHHFISENFNFNALYTGYLGSKEQVNIVSDIFDTFKTENNVIVVDPVMADNGKLYAGFTQDFVKEMVKLSSKADIIIPNLTEATFMLDEKYIEKDYSEDYIKNILKALTDLGVKKSILTGVSFDNENFGVMMYDKEKNEYFSYFNKKINTNFHGTGDVFASAFVGALMNNLPTTSALKIAVDFTLDSIKETVNEENSNWYGVNFEYSIPKLLELLKEEKQLYFK